MRDRKPVIEALLTCPADLGSLQEDLAALPWDSDAPVAILRCAHVVSVLERYLAGNRASEDVSAWAECIEGRDDIGHEPAMDEVMLEIIHELANPLLTQPLTQVRATELINTLSSCEPLPPGPPA